MIREFLVNHLTIFLYVSHILNYLKKIIQIIFEIQYKFLSFKQIPFLLFFFMFSIKIKIKY